MLEFSGWNFIGASSAVLRYQGINILLNLFFGVSVNIARGIAIQMQNAIYSFISNFQTAVNPQITGNYATTNLDRVKDLVLQGGRLSFYLLMLMALPLLIETNELLTLWLDQTVAFVRLTMIYLLLDYLSRFMIVTVQATGNIKKYQLIVGGLKMSVIFITYLFFLLGSSPITGFLVNINIESICLAIRIQFMHTII